MKTLKERFNDRWICSMGGCFEWLGARSMSGYGKIRIEGRDVGAHRVSWYLNTGEWPDDIFVCHTCDNPCCVRFDHLFIGTHADNMQDMVEKGRAFVVRGEGNGSSKLTVPDVKFIRDNSNNYGDQAKLARKFNVSVSAINCIIKRRSWSHV
jgi:hypothetical protein